MLNWFSKYRSPFAVKPAAPAAPAASTPKAQAEAQASAADKAQRKAQARAQQAEQDQAEWAPRLQAALGDEAALLQLALDCPVLALRQAAVEALTGEDALRQAEQAFRSKDRRLHQVAKRRFEAAVLCRETRARADVLIDEARSLAAQPLVPVNHLVALDRGWTALDASLLLPEQAGAFATLRQSLDGLAQDQAERQQRNQRRLQALQQQMAAVQAAGQGWLAALEAGAADAPPSVADEAAAPAATPDAHPEAALDAACVALQRLLDDAEGAALDPRPQAAAAALLQDADALRQRLHWLARPATARPRPAPAAQPESPAADTGADTGAAPAADAASAVDAVPVADAAAQPDSPPANEPDPPASPAQSPDAAAPADPVPSPVPSWAALPPVAHAPWAEVLVRLHAARQRPARVPSPAPRAAAAPADRPARRAGPAPLTPAQRDALAQRLQQAEAALADGHLAPLQQQLQAVEQALAQAAPLAPADPLAQRVAALAAEHQRLKGWQQWGGGRARDDLAAEAEVLARATAAAADPALADAPKLDLKAHAEAIAALRGRWRELDRLGAAASQALWQRFDTALKAAYQPVGERQAAQKAQRLQNQREREALLAALEAWPGQPPLADAPVDAAAASAAAPAAGRPADGTPAAEPLAAPAAAADAPQGAAPAAEEPVLSGSWKDRQRAIDRFQTAWRQLGPLEHTVPAAARETLRQRHLQVLARLEAPLQQARRDAVARREALIQQAEALAARAAAAPAAAPAADAGRRGGFGDGPRRAGPDDLAQQVRQLQADWQQQARELALPRGLEATLWGRFRAALDAVFAQRQAVFQARDAAAAAQQAEREAWIARLTALPADAPAAEVRRVLAEVDQAWRAPLDLPRGQAMALDHHYRDARAALQQRLAGAAARQWQAWCDALSAGLQQAQRREQGEPGDTAEAADAPPADLPPAWALALAERAAAGGAPGPLSAQAFDARLLVLEAALDMPASAEQQAARRLLKLQALKQTLEGRAAPAAAPVAPADALLAALRQAQLPPAQQQRVQAVLAALRQAAPGVAGLPVPRI